METTQKKIKGWGELAFVLGTVLLAIGVSLMEKGGFGMSMVTSMSYIISLGIEPLSFGTADYLLQGLLLVFYYIIVRRFRAVHLLSFFSAFLFGITLDGVMWLLKGVELTSVWMRIAFFAVGMATNALGVAVFFKTYLPLQVYELFVEGLCERFKFPLSRAKTGFDIACCLTAAALSLLFFGELRALGIGTVMCALFNGTLIGMYHKIMDKYIDFSPAFPKLYEVFEGWKDAKAKA